MNNSTAMGSQPGGYSAYNSIETGVYRPGSNLGFQHVSATKPANNSSLNTVKRFIKPKTQGPSQVSSYRAAEKNASARSSVKSGAKKLGWDAYF